MKLFLTSALLVAPVAATDFDAYRIRADGVCVESTVSASSSLSLLSTGFRDGACATAGFIAPVAGEESAFKLPEQATDEDFDTFFTHFTNLHSKQYANEEEVATRKAVFRANAKEVLAHNQQYVSGKTSFWIGFTPLADLSFDEYKQQYLTLQTTPRAASAQSTFDVDSVKLVPDSWDWRKDSNSTVVTPVKNQGSCGSCWAFSAVATMEGRYALDSGDLQSFSEQELVDCTMKGEYTCDEGGEMHDGVDEIATNHGGKINTETQYPYQGTSGHGCRAKDSEAIDAGITGYSNVTIGDETALKAAAYARPIISVGIDASSIAFQLYVGGVYDPIFCSSKNLDHGVSVVGYGTSETKKDYWWVKNSWGEMWGEHGYVEMIRNKNNHCGIATDACYALSKSAPK